MSLILVISFKYVNNMIYILYKCLVFKYHSVHASEIEWKVLISVNGNVFRIFRFSHLYFLIYVCAAYLSISQNAFSNILNSRTEGNGFLLNRLNENQ